MSVNKLVCVIVLLSMAAFVTLTIWFAPPSSIERSVFKNSVPAQVLPIEGYERYDLARSVIIRFEGFSPVAYKCPSGKRTIGYGRTEDVCAFDTTTEEREQMWLMDQIKRIDKSLDLVIKVQLADSQKAALISFVYNVGLGNFKKSTMLKKLNAGDIDGAGDEFSKWVYAKGHKLNGLIHRREEEAKLFMLMSEGELK